jgi:hypothetical protein
VTRLAESRRYFTTGGLPPISSSWRQTLETHDQIFFNRTFVVIVRV